MALNSRNFKKVLKLAITSLATSVVGKRWNSKFFLTTPIFYVNGDPHIGHLYTALIGDAVNRYQKLKNPGVSTKYMVGTDEHGLKVYQSAKNKNMSVKEFCDKVSSKYQNMFDLFNIEADDFVRTTEDRHKKAATALWNKIFSKGYIYKEKYSGWYCVADEMFVSEAFLSPVVGKNDERFTIEGNKPVQYLEEINYKFKLSSFEDDVLHWLKGDSIQPTKFHSDMNKWIERGFTFKDISVSRPSNRVPWGIPVPGDESQNIYVWLDALSSYLCTNGYPDNNFKWPPDIQIIGKDILKFHTIFWPAFLMAAGLEPPKCIFCHSHWMRNDEKMSKSKGNVVDPFQQSKIFTSEGFRYFLLRGGVSHKDGNFSDAKVFSTLNSELADCLGNLLNRCTSKAINRKQTFPAFCEENFLKIDVQQRESIQNALIELPEKVQTHFEELNFYKAVDEIMSILHLTNKVFFDLEPWALIKNKENEGLVEAVLHLTMECLRVCGLLLQPVIPNISRSMLDKLSIDRNKRNLSDVRPYSWEVKEAKESSLNAEKIILFSKIK